MRSNRYFVLVLALLLVSLAGFAQRIGTYDPAAEQEMVRRVNQERTQRGLRPLQVDDRLTQAARQHSVVQAQHGQISHQFHGEPPDDKRMAATGVRFDHSGENVAVDSGGPDQAHVALMNSPPHRENILDPNFNSIGIGVVKLDSIIYVTEDFAGRLPEQTSVDDADRQIAREFNEMRRQAGAKALRVVANPELHEVACEMAKKNSLDPKKAGALPGVARVVTIAIGNLDDMPQYLQPLTAVPAGGFSVGTCYASSRSYASPVYWVIIVTYF